MKNILSCAIFLMAVMAFGQAPSPTATMPGSANSGRNELFVGYERTFNDWGSSSTTYDFNGVDINYTRMLNRHWGALAQFDVSRNGNYDATYYTYDAGVRYNFLTSRVRPFGQFLIGAGHLKGEVETLQSDGSHALGTHNWFGFSWTGGGGVDVDVTNHFGLRGEFDAVSVPFGAHQHDRDIWSKMAVGGYFRW